MDKVLIILALCMFCSCKDESSCPEKANDPAPGWFSAIPQGYSDKTALSSDSLTEAYLISAQQSKFSDENCYTEYYKALFYSGRIYETDIHLKLNGFENNATRLSIDASKYPSYSHFYFFTGNYDSLRKTYGGAAAGTVDFLGAYNHAGKIYPNVYHVRCSDTAELLQELIFSREYGVLEFEDKKGRRWTLTP